MYQIVKNYHENIQAISKFKATSRFLWDDHVSYTRNAITSILSNLPDIEAVSSRLIENQDDIGAFISPYYSADQTFTFVDLLKKHIAIAVDVVNEVKGAEVAWRANGNDFVMYMNQLNPMFWSIRITEPMWTDHLDMTIAQINARKLQAWDKDIEAYDTNHWHMNNFADLISTGIICQNIDNFV